MQASATVGTPDMSAPMLMPDSGNAAATGLKLRDIHLPQHVDWWPLAPGWWVLMAIVITLLAAGAWWLYRYRKLAFRREALQLLQELELQQQQKKTDANTLAFIDDISALLKRVAITAHGREQVANKSGDAWLQFLDATGKTKGFTQGPGRSLGATRFQPTITVDKPALIALCREWIQQQSC